jgi:hypothetical protein
VAGRLQRDDLPRRRTLVLAVAGCLSVTGIAAAATGSFSVGDVIPAGTDTGAPDYQRPVEQVVVAQGTAPVAGPWRMTSYKSEQLVDSRGEEMQPAGLPCLRLVLTDPPAGVAQIGRWSCGASDDSFAAAELPVLDAAGRAEMILFGRAPESAREILLTASGRSALRSPTEEGPPDFRGDPWVIAVPPGLGQRAPQLGWIGENGAVASARLDVTRSFETTPAVRAKQRDP